MKENVYSINLDWDQIRKECVFTSQRSRGPGGQHINKTSSAAMIHWPIESSSALSEGQKNSLIKKLKNSINNNFEVFIRSDVHRELDRNKQECWEKLKNLISKGLYRKKPRKKTKPTKSSQLKRLDTKSKHGKNKNLRKKVY